jgi:hypothetical protein
MVDYALVRGRPDLSQIWSVDDGNAFRFPLRERDPLLLIQTTSRPVDGEREFRGSIDPILAGGTTGTELFTEAYKRKRNINGQLYLLKVMPMVAKAHWALFGSGLVFAGLLFFFIRRQGHGIPGTAD